MRNDHGENEQSLYRKYRVTIVLIKLIKIHIFLMERRYLVAPASDKNLLEWLTKRLFA